VLGFFLYNGLAYHAEVSAKPEARRAMPGDFYRRCHFLVEILPPPRNPCSRKWVGLDKRTV